MEVDDLKKGQRIAITGTRSDDVHLLNGIVGIPLIVKAVSLPFIAVELNDGQIVGADTRHVLFCKVSRAYAKALTKKPVTVTTIQPVKPDDMEWAD
jgi:hypothetical protein